MKIVVSFLDFMSATPISASNSQPCAQSLSCAQLLETSWTVARQAPLSMGFPRQEYWSGLPFPPPGNLPSLGIEPESPASPELADSLPWSQNTLQLISSICDFPGPVLGVIRHIVPLSGREHSGSHNWAVVEWRRGCESHG